MERKPDSSVQGIGPMRFTNPVVLCAFAICAAGVMAQDVTGTILIKKQLTKPSVTAPVSVYQRGPAVQLSKDADDGPIAYEMSRVVIYLEGPQMADGGAAVHPVQQIQQLDRRFMPDLVVVPIGSAVSFPNLDPIFHNIYSLSKAKTFDLGSYDKGETRKVVFPKPGIVQIYCHLHPNMAATVVVTPNRWYAKPDAKGQYRIPDVPPGKYTVVAWHKAAGFFRKSIVIENGHNGVADFFIPIDIDSKQDAQLKRAANHSGGS
jgi:plastocyanin